MTSKSFLWSVFFAAVCWGCIQRQPAPAPGEASAAPGAAAATEALPPPPSTAAIDGLPRVALLGPGGVRELEVQGEKGNVNVSVVPVEGQPFTEALRAEIKIAGNSDWTVQSQARTIAPVDKGDVLLATFYVRAVKPQESGKTETQFVFERASGPYTKSVTYPLFLTDQWRKVMVRFKSVEKYAAGEAQMIFRMGYEPETFEVGGVTVENFGKQVKLLQLPSTELADLKIKPKPIKEELPVAVDGGELLFEVAPAQVAGKISPYVYGINSQPIADTRAPLRRMGGNRQSAYNWEINASSAGSDWQHLNDAWPCTNLGYTNCDEPGGQTTSFVLENKKAGADSIVVVPLIDWVSADKAGPVPENEAAPSKRYLRSQLKKSGPYSLTPDRKDGAVYQDEFINFLVQKLGRADAGGVKFYALDNEPALWSSTHPRVHPQRATYAEVVSKSEAAAEAVTRIDPSAQVLGGVMFGWSEFMSLSSAPDSVAQNAKYGTYIDFFLASMKELEAKHGRRLVHVLDVHWYPEMRGTTRITEDDTSLKTIAARVAAPRSFWDPHFQEKSWIGDEWKKPIRFFPWLKERIAERYPGTKLALTEYNFGAGDHISGGLAQVDVLGILGREGVLIGNYWGKGAGVGPLPVYVAAAHRLYRNYDGKGGEFGDTSVASDTKDREKGSIHAAVRKDGRLTLIVINKDLAVNHATAIKIAGPTKYTSAQAYVLDSSSPNIRPLAKLAIQGNVIRTRLPRLSATLFVCDPG